MSAFIATSSRLSTTKIVFALIIMCGVVLCTNIAHALDVKGVRFGSHPDKIRLVVELDQVSDFRVFLLDNPKRLVIDLPHFSWRAGRPDKTIASHVVDIRQGKLDNAISRIVFDLSAPIMVQSAFLLPASHHKPARLVIDYTIVDSGTFNLHRHTIHGTLTPSTIKPSPRTAAAGTILKTTLVQTSSGELIPLPPANARRPLQKTSPNKTRQKPLIVIDPGHGGVDPGALGKGKIYEKNIVLALSKALKKHLEATGKYRVIMTRETDIFIRLHDRVKFARTRKADLFISIHADSIKRSNVRGTSIYTLSKKASDEQTAHLAEKENQVDLIAGVDLSTEDEQVAFILGDFLMNDTMNQSKFFANTVVEKLQSEGLRVLQKPHRYAGFAVLKAPDIPSILIEAGFVSNPQEAKLLNSPAHRQKIARAIGLGVNAYFDQVYKNESQ